MLSEESRLDALLAAYRAACPDVEASANFMPSLWQKIEARHGFWFIFQHLAGKVMTGCAALCLLLLALNLFSVQQAHFATPSYADALMADHSAEETDYTEAVRASLSGEEMHQPAR
jgi:hypothetical protein